MKKLLVITCFLFICFGCTNKDPTFQSTGNDTLELTKIMNKGVTDQQPANQAKQFLSQYEEVSGVRAVNKNDDLIVAVDIHHHDRLSLDHLEKELKKDVKRNFSEMNVTLSTDQKILLELKRLEEDIEANKVTNEHIKKRLKKIKKLSEEET